MHVVFFIIINLYNYLDLITFLMLFNNLFHDTLINRIFIFILRNFSLKIIDLELFYHHYIY